MSSLLFIFSIIFLLLIHAPCSSSFAHEQYPVQELGTVSHFIPFANAGDNKDLDRDVFLNFTITTTHSPEAHHFSAAMDTGSTGVVISAKQLKLSLNDLENYSKGSEYLSSSHVYWEGYWIDAVDVNLTFTAAEIIAKVPILAVTESSICVIYANGVCDPCSKTNVTYWPSNIPYLGE